MHVLRIEIVKIKCRLVNLAVKNRHPLIRWAKGVLAILEKSLGNANMQKLRAILLLEADFNVLHKIIFNRRMILVLEA